MQRIVGFAFLLVLIVPQPASSTSAIDCRVNHKFSSEGSIAQAVIHALRQAKQRVVLALYGFNNDELADELLTLVQRGVNVRLKIDAAKAHEKKTARLIGRLKKSGVQISAVSPDGRNHNKFAVIDGSRVLTGSYNWTKKAENNWENLLILDCPELARKYEQEWEKIQ